MNDTQKSLIIVGLVLMLLGIAQHVLFVEQLRNRLVTEQSEYELAGLSDDDTVSETELVAQDESFYIEKLQRKLKIAKIFQYVFGIFGILCIWISWIFRNPKEENDVEDGWDDDDDWDDDE